MFKKLRLKLILINVSIILALFLLLIIGVYWFSQTDITRHRDFMARKITSDIQSGFIKDLPQRNGGPGGPNAPPPAPLPGGPGRTPPDVPSGPPPRPDFFFVKTSSTGMITFQSSGQPLTSDRLIKLTEKTFKTDLLQGTIVLDQTEYSYLKSLLSNEPGMLILFHDLTQETNMLKTLLTALSAVGIVCLLLSFGASFFMANRAMIPIQQAWQQQKDFLSDASHELRTPLAVIQTNLDIVRGSPDETVSSLSKWLDNIQEESICMMQLVDSLLFLARADSQQQLLNKNPFSFNTLLWRAVAPFEAVAAAKKLCLEVFADLPINGYGDETRIKQVIGILLDNAIRHTSDGGKISVSLSQSASKILLTVADSGEGIEPEHLDKIFNRFYQVDKSRSNGSSGLGLAIAKWIIGAHGGAITVDSTFGVGTTFTVELPCNTNQKLNRLPSSTITG